VMLVTAAVCPPLYAARLEWIVHSTKSLEICWSRCVFVLWRCVFPWDRTDVCLLIEGDADGFGGQRLGCDSED